MIGSVLTGSVRTGEQSVRTAGALDCACDDSDSPPLIGSGLVLWLNGAVDLQSTMAGEATNWLDQSGLGQDVTTNPAFRPLTGVDAIDGVPCLSFPLLSSSTTYMQRTATLLNRFGAPFGAAQARTLMAVIIPKFSGSAFNITGGPVFNSIEQPQWQCLFDLEDTAVPDAMYAWSSGWRDLASALRAPDVPGGSGGPYNGVPTLAEWASLAYNNISFGINGAPKALTPAVEYGGSGPTPPGGFLVGNVAPDGLGLNFLGAIAEILVWDQILSVVERAQALAYFANRYPSLGL